MRQADLFDTATEADVVNSNKDDDKAAARQTPIAVPCGFADRSNRPCNRLGKWPVMADGKQLVCRDRPMVHCDAACFAAQVASARYGEDDDDILWEGAAGVDDDDG